MLKDPYLHSENQPGRFLECRQKVEEIGETNNFSHILSVISRSDFLDLNLPEFTKNSIKFFYQNLDDKNYEHFLILTLVNF